ncbi:hypothetical protein Bra3105_06735 [Brachybacterium halotolerans subsp. kimchii]|uniref:VG15 protein n=1 Tax=Brachybacterium halotolerans TaxID=2795215 RepID=UPI001E2EC276|nr:hypothetical protein [Brachybacterium halotolerans]UEJ84003.1 hypothetical protein Bra3105_06735 [Brachybacterium halotolerans subsp. kimchii]
MVSRAEAGKFKRANDQLTHAIQRDIRKAWGALGAYSPEGKRDALLDIVPGLVSTYGDAAAAVAMEYFETTTGARGTIHDGSTPEAVQGSIRALIGGLWTGQEAEAISLVIGSATRHMLQAGRSSIYRSTRSTPGLRFARVPEAGACDWCRIMSSRGAVYLSRESAGGENNKYHDDCACLATAIRDGDELPYDAEALYAEYKPAWEAAGGTGVQAGEVAREMRRIRAAAA